MSAEEWKAVVGYEGAYEVSTLGRVRSFRRERPQNGWLPERIMSPMVKKDGYCQIHLQRNGAVSRRYIHRLVVEAFCGKIPEDRQVNHVDGDKSNNKIANLEIVSAAENIQHAIRSGLKRVSGEGSPTCRLRSSEVWLIRKLKACGIRSKFVAAMFKIRHYSYVDALARCSARKGDGIYEP